MANSNTTHDRAWRLSLESASLRHPDGTLAFQSVDLRVDAGEIVAVVGPSGCGKSSLLRAISGLAEITDGECRADRSSLGYVFQDANLLPWRNVMRNVELVAELRGVDKSSRRQIAGQSLRTVGLEHEATKYPSQLSGGMRMRVSLARALSMEPDLLLLDEPFGALDELSRERLQEELLRIHEERNFAAVLVTHSVSEAVLIADRVLCMSPSPGTVVTAIEVDLPRPRTASMRFTPEFADTCRRVSSVVRG